ncbi:hypothetical protein HPB47_000454 [Ixodes persulcatus]|uniref:Uncharacterized protein n=1 Tax=Ixodes persulcatus TaxID=34615 RepID=A0AC60PRR3_IXOPE|nr:hypothetical protein HPB47_000454 [Ixodes persulcatus]
MHYFLGHSPWIAISAARKRALRVDKGHLRKLYRLKRNRRVILLTNLADSSTGVKKKIIAVARTKQHSVLLLWLKTIIRHIYWCARTSNGDGQLVLARWTSLMRHIINIHEHPDQLHPVCTETFNKLKAILMAPHLLRDIPFLSPKKQTSGLKSYNAVLIHFAPKDTKFRFEGMLARTYVAALHFNHNADRKVLLDENGKPRFRQKWSKGEKQWTLVAVGEKVTYDYVQKLVDSVLECVTRWPSYAVAERARYRQSHDILTSRHCTICIELWLQLL